MHQPFYRASARPGLLSMGSSSVRASRCLRPPRFAQRRDSPVMAASAFMFASKRRSGFFGGRNFHTATSHAQLDLLPAGCLPRAHSEANMLLSARYETEVLYTWQEQD